MNKVLIVEDEIAIADLIKMGLTNSGYICDYALDGEAGADMVESNLYDLVLLDIMLPKIDGYELLEYIQTVGTPVIFITAKGLTKDKIKGLNMGADDYLVKPFEIDELIARVESVLRRYNKGHNRIVIEDIIININARRVLKQNEPIYFTPKEFDLLVLFAQNKNVSLSKEKIFQTVWEEEYEVETRTIDLHVQRIRKKLGWKDKIKTVYKRGYILEV